jgi:predicted TPR repeat methyltransferase
MMRAQANLHKGLETPVAVFGVVSPPSGPAASASLSASGLRRLALTLWAEGKPDAATDLLQAACELAPGDAAIWGDLAGALNAASKPQEAKHCMERSLAIDEAQPRAWLLLATICVGLADDAAAERAFARSLDLDPMLADAAFGLGILYFRQQRFQAAAEQFGLAVRLGRHDRFVHICRGKALHLVGAFSEAASAYAVAAQFDPVEPQLLQELALLRLIETVMSGSVEQALAAYRRIAGARGEDIGKATETAFHQLSGYGHREAAIRLGRKRLALAPDDPIQRYLLAALSGEEMARAPEDYLVAYFDRFAQGFDKQLVEMLGYDVPRTLKMLTASIKPRFSAMLDLGCGTGLAATQLRALGGTLTGVDLSPAMLERASARRLYDKLVESDVLAYLSEENATSGSEPFDLVFAADLLIYFGKLEGLVGAVARRVASGGLFALSVETLPDERGSGYRLLASGRFAHSLVYLEAVAKREFELVATQETQLRLEANRPVEGALVVLRRR